MLTPSVSSECCRLTLSCKLLNLLLEKESHLLGQSAVHFKLSRVWGNLFSTMIGVYSNIYRLNICKYCKCHIDMYLLRILDIDGPKIVQKLTFLVQPVKVEVIIGHVQHYWQLLRILLCFLYVRETCQKWNHVYLVSLNARLNVTIVHSAPFSVSALPPEDVFKMSTHFSAHTFNIYSHSVKKLHLNMWKTVW